MTTCMSHCMAISREKMVDQGGGRECGALSINFVNKAKCAEHNL